MPFPSKTKEVEFNYEALLKDNVCRSDTDSNLALLLKNKQRRLEHHLTSTIASIASLRDETEKRKQRLASAKQDLETLEKDCRGEDDRRKRQTKKVRHECRVCCVALRWHSINFPHSSSMHCG